MKSDLDHLPETKRRELEHIKTVLMREFEEAIAGGTQPWRRNGKILKIILFGSFSRNDWVDEPENGYQSDWDLLVIVSHEKLTDIAVPSTNLIDLSGAAILNSYAQAVLH